MKKFKDLTPEEVEKLKSTGLLWEIFPEANLNSETVEPFEPMHVYELYPKDEEPNPFLRPPYILEFSKWRGQDTTYKISRRNLLITEQEYKEAISSNDLLRTFSVEGHPYTLLSGVVNLKDYVIDFETKPFLKFVVDALNSYTKTLDNI